jgi:hypothetical protein
MRQVAGRQLWIGHAGDLRDARTILDAGIVAVVELADSELHAVLPRDLIRCRFRCPTTPTIRRGSFGSR